MIGETVSHYRILSALGEGGMGVVYRADDLKLKRTVALKFLQAPERLRLLREAQTAAALNHPNVCAIYELDEERGFLAMEYVAGRTLREWIGGRPLPVNDAIGLGMQIAEGLRAAHEGGIVHRDVKSSNIMVAESGQVKIMDFGLARGTGDEHSQNRIAGTPGYMSPEQAAGGPVDRRSDIWAFGVVMHEMLTGRVPAAGALDPLPPALDRIVRKALAPAPGSRYQHVADLLVDLRQARRNPSGRVSRRGAIAAAGGAAIASAAAAAWWLRGGTKIESLAVLPLENLSGSAEQDYFADGITDELIGEISRIGALRVISRTSVMRYKGVHRPLPDIARELNVDAIVEGTVSQAGRRVRISAQLIRARDERSLWSSRFERDLSEVLALQSEVARAIAGEIRIQLSPEERTMLARTRRVSPDAYESFLRGNAFLHRGVAGIARSIENFRKAIALDAGSAEAHSGLAQALVYSGIFGFRSTAELFPQARESALTALRLDETNAGAHNALADVKKGYDWDMAGAEASYLRALHFNPNHYLTRLWYAEWMTRMGRFDDALAQSSLAIAIDPVSPLSHNNRGLLLWRAHRYDEAIRSCQLALDLDPSYLNAYWWQGAAWAEKGEYAKGAALLEKALAMTEVPLGRAMLGYIHGRSGDTARARETLTRLETMSRVRYVAPADIAIVWAGLRDTDRTFEWLEKAYEARSHGVHQIRSPHCDFLRTDRRFGEFLKRVGLPA